jgi:Transglutaminase-like superfamily
VKRLHQFAGLPEPERRLLLRAVLLVAAARIALWTLPFSLVRRLFGGPPSQACVVTPYLTKISPRRLAWAVQASARRIPRASCLTQALALQSLLAKTGRSGQVRVGVSKDAERGFEAHAWLEHQGEILVGNNGELDRFSPILTLPNAVERSKA